VEYRIFEQQNVVGESQNQITALGWLISRPARGSPLKRRCPHAASIGLMSSKRSHVRTCLSTIP